MKLFLALTAVVALFHTAAAAQEPAISFRNGEFQVTGWQFGAEPRDGWASVFRVYSGNESSSPMLGFYSIERGALIFHPRFPLSPHVAYRAVFGPADAPLTQTIVDPAPLPRPSTHVEQIYPSADVLPGNVLKLYIAFSASMSRGEAWKHIHLLDAQGAPVKLALLEIEQELWDAEHMRLTVLFDPGRIKRGLVPANELGTPIVEGRRYTLLIDKEWPDANGVPLTQEFRKEFRGGPVDRLPPTPNLWKISAPSAGTRDPLVVTFPKPMDWALLQRMLRVRGVPGQISIGAHETELRFIPSTPWIAGTHMIEADSALEDIAGNRLNREFDMDTMKSSIPPEGPSTISIPFEVN